MSTTHLSAVDTSREEHAWALVLAGGDGTRLQELTRLISGRPIPKQYCRIDGRRSLLEATLDRIAPSFVTERTMAIVSRAHLSLARPQLASLPRANVIVQARNRDTGPGLLAPLLEIARRDPEALVSVFPSDHFVSDSHAFRRHVERSRAAVARRPDRIALIGIRPEWPESGYGYIERGAALDRVPESFGVRCFREKPAPQLARALVARGALWNSFILTLRAARVIELVAELRPADLADLRAAQRDPSVEPRPWNFSSDFLARVPGHLAVLEAPDIGWSDWGTREAIERTLAAQNRTPWWSGVPAQPALGLQPAL